MAIHSISLDTSTTIVANTSGDIWLVKAGVEVTTAGDAIDGTGSNGNKTFLIHGHLIAEDDGIDLGDSVLNNGGSNRVHILPTGSIFAESQAIESAGGYLDLINDGNLFSIGATIIAEDGHNVITNTGTIASSISAGIQTIGGNNAISNDGAITASGFGIEAYDGFSQITNTGTIISLDSYGIYTTDGNNTISNDGDITAKQTGINAFGTGNLIVNSGSVVSSNPSVFYAAVRIAGLAGETNRLVNSGEISGQLNAVLGADGNETVINRGGMNGNVDLGAGNDTFKGWGGTVDGWIHGRGGNDTLIGGAADDAIFGDDGNDLLKGGSGDDFISGGWGSDLLMGGSDDDTLNGGYGNDLLKGGSGDDTIIGHRGSDVMRGGLGSDTFDFNNTNDSAVGSQRDRIEDFSKVDDYIDVSTIDAKTGNLGNQFFTFIGTQGFHGVKGELHAVNSGANTIVEGDTNGDGNADFSILVVGVHNLTAGDFIL